MSSCLLLNYIGFTETLKSITNQMQIPYLPLLKNPNNKPANPILADGI